MTRGEDVFLKVMFVAVGALCLVSTIAPWVALAGGIAFALMLGNPFYDHTGKLTPRLLGWAIIALGAGMNLDAVMLAGSQGFFYTAISIALTLLFGFALGRLFNAGDDRTALISAGTAICGGSAIAAIAPVIRAKQSDIAVSLAIVFSLNALALVVFPVLGHLAGLSQEQFGLWAALAIHDTSSVVGATLQYGPQALETGTTIKLARALWIIPLAIGMGFYMAQRTKADDEPGAPKIKVPWFIGGFIAMAALVTYVPALSGVGDIVAGLGRKVLVLTLFLIGAGLTRETLSTLSPRPFVLGALLWVVISICSLCAIMMGWIGV